MANRTDRLRTIDSHELGPILHKSAAAVQADLSRAPHRLPPAIRIEGGGAALWLESDVLDWLRQHQVQQTKRRGRPTKLEQARRLAAVEVKS